MFLASRVSSLWRDLRVRQKNFERTVRQINAEATSRHHDTFWLQWKQIDQALGSVGNEGARRGAVAIGAGRL